MYLYLVMVIDDKTGRLHAAASGDCNYYPVDRRQAGVLWVDQLAKADLRSRNMRYVLAKVQVHNGVTLTLAYDPRPKTKKKGSN